MMKLHEWIIFSCLFLTQGLVHALTLNSPYTQDEINQKYYFSDFREAPKHLDPARAYSSDEYRILGAVTESLFGYDYFSDVYTLVPLAARDMPAMMQKNKDGFIELVIHLRDDLVFSPHPCFLDENEIDSQLSLNKNVDSPFQLQKGQRQVTAYDFAYQIKRMADPRLHCPIFPMVLSSYIKGMTEFQSELNRVIEKGRQTSESGQNELSAGGHSQGNGFMKPLLNYHEFECEGIQVPDKLTLKLILNPEGSKMLYWMALPFFSPVPHEALKFYSRPAVFSRGWRLDRYPVSNGPFYVHTFSANRLIQLNRTEGYRKRIFKYDNGEEAVLPFLDQIRFYREAEPISRWLKFKQGYYDVSGISNDHFFEVFQPGKGHSLSDFFVTRDITSRRMVLPTLMYMGFNMLDPVVGGRSEEKTALRQAICIAIDREGYLEQFLNGRGEVAHSPIPPGIFGYGLSRELFNASVFDWDETISAPRRKSIDEARQLLVKAGYPGGVDPRTGEGLILFFDTLSTAGNVAYKDWLQKQLKKLNIYLEFRETDYNRFREKMSTGTAQLFSWGWNADYPDPENFLFLFYGPNGRVRFKGENPTNYENKEFDVLYKHIEGQPNNEERLGKIHQMVRLLQQDCPIDFGYYPEAVTLAHSWVRHYSVHPFSNEVYTYLDVDINERKEYQQRENQVSMGPVFMLVFMMAGFTLLWKTARGRGKLP